MSISAPHAVRRGPMQERSQETVGRILASAGRLLARGTAPQGLTTAQIAAEAGLSVGALYRFFPDKQAIVDAIALRHLEVFQDTLAAALMANLPDSPGGFLDAVIDAFAAYLEANADFRTLAYGPPGGDGRAISRSLFDAQMGSPASPDPQAGNDETGTEETGTEETGAGDMAAMVRDVLSGMYGLETDADFDFRLRIAAEIGDRLFAHGFAQQDPCQRARVLSEAKHVLRSYLFN